MFSVVVIVVVLMQIDRFSMDYLSRDVEKRSEYNSTLLQNYIGTFKKMFLLNFSWNYYFLTAFPFILWVFRPFKDMELIITRLITQIDQKHNNQVV